MGEAEVRRTTWTPVVPASWHVPSAWTPALDEVAPVLSALAEAVGNPRELLGQDSRHCALATRQWIGDSSAWLLEFAGGIAREVWMEPLDRLSGVPPSRCRLAAPGDRLRSFGQLETFQVGMGDHAAGRASSALRAALRDCAP